MNSLEFNVLIGSFEESDKDLFFGPLTNLEHFKTSRESRMANLLHSLGLFSSIGQARKAGWDKEIPAGFSDLVIGKLQKRVTILNIK